MDWQVLGICIVIGILLTIVGELFTEEKRASKRNSNAQKYCSGKDNYKFHNSYNFKKAIPNLNQSHILYLKDAYNQRFDNVIKIDEEDFTIYLGDFFYQLDVKKTWLDKVAERNARYGTRFPVYDSQWPSNVPVPRNVGKDYYNYYYFQKFCIIKPKINISFPNFHIRVKRWGLKNFENIVKLDGHPIFNSRYMLSASDKFEVEKFLKNGKMGLIDKYIDRSYLYETLDGIFIIRSEASLSDSIKRMHKNALAMFTGILASQENLSRKYSNSLYLSSGAIFRYCKAFAIIFAICFISYVTYQGSIIRDRKKVFKSSFNDKITSFVSSKEVYVPELMKGYTWKNVRQIRLVDAMVFDYNQINMENREKFFPIRFNVVKPKNLEDYQTRLLPQIKEKLGQVETYSERTYEEAIIASYRCDPMLIVDTCARWLFVSRYYAQQGDLETAFLLPYAGIRSAWESENKTADSMTFSNRIQHLDAMNISAYHLLYLTVKYNPDANLLKSIAKDMLKIAKDQHHCSAYIKYFRELFKNIFKQDAANGNSFAQKLFEYNLIEKFSQEYFDAYLRFADAPYPEIYKDYCKWSPNVIPGNSSEEKEIIRSLKVYLPFTKVSRHNQDYMLFRKIVEEYLTKLEGIAIAILCKAYELEKGELPENRTELELWSNETLPVDRFTNQPYEINKSDDVKLSSAGLDLKAGTKADIRFW